MTSASVKNTGFDAGLLTTTARATSVQHVQDGQDFGTIMNQTKSKAQQVNTSVAKPKTVQKSMQNKTGQLTADTDNSVKKDMTADTAEDVQNVTENVSPNEAENEVIDEDVKETVDIAVGKLMDTIKEEFDLSEDELAAIMEQLGLQPLDLLQPLNLAELVVSAGGAQSLIEVAADADMYQHLQNLTDTVNTLMNEVMDETGLSEDELQAVIEQLGALEEQSTKQGELAEADNILSFAEPQGTDMEMTSQTLEAEDTVPVIKTETSTQQTTEIPTETEEAAQAPQMTEKTEKENSQGEEETTSYQQGQDNSNKFQNVLDNTLTAVENEAVPTRTVDTESIMKQLADYVKINTGKELTEMEMQLHPASLGTVRIQLASKGGAVTAQITAQNETVKNAIESQIVQLKDNLENQGVKVEAVEVSVASHEMEKNLDQNGREQHSREQDNTMGSIRKIRRSNINLNLYNSEEEALEEASGLDDAARIAMEMMAANGNTMDLLA